MSVGRRQFVNVLLHEAKNKRHFINFFKKKKKKVELRPGALPPEKVREIVKQLGKGKKVNIRRVEYDGTPEEKPVTVRIIDITDEYFTGNVINVERSIKQELNEHVVYIKGGGGTIDFYYDDGDIMSIEEDVDEQIIQQRNTEELLEILDALEINEDILVSYYDEEKGGVINGRGKLVEKDLDSKNFSVEFHVINDIELDKPKRIQLNLEKNMVLDIEVVL
ncbi:hypothetical protein DRI50_04630 [candidate division KSB1 bacterium]|nr:MAG: hypothetical protein DRI50_04630 [candidate division KSB1 bacterium]